MTSSSYIISGGTEGFDRLKVLSRVMQPSTYALFDRVGIAPGMHCLDVGCGSGDVTMELARKVGDDGRVVGIDLDTVKLDLARGNASAAHLRHVEFRQADVCTLTGRPEYDLIYARFVLTHLRDPGSALANLRTLLRPGGALVIEDIDVSACFCYPLNPAFERFVELYIKTGQSRGADPLIGPRLHSLFATVGFSSIQLSLTQPVGAIGEVKLIGPLTMSTIAPAVIADGHATAAELTGVIAGLQAMAADDFSVMGMPSVFQVWAREPARS